MANHHERSLALLGIREMKSKLEAVVHLQEDGCEGKKGGGRDKSW